MAQPCSARSSEEEVAWLPRPREQPVGPGDGSSRAVGQVTGRPSLGGHRDDTSVAPLTCCRTSFRCSHSCRNLLCQSENCQCLGPSHTVSVCLSVCFRAACRKHLARICVQKACSLGNLDLGHLGSTDKQSPPHRSVDKPEEHSRSSPEALNGLKPTKVTILMRHCHPSFPPFCAPPFPAPHRGPLNSGPIIMSCT